MLTQATPSSVATASQPEAKRRWLVVIGAMVGVAVGLSPVPFYTVGMFAPELSKAFGWSFAAMMATLTIQSAVSIVTSPIAGLMIDRFGARPVAMISLALFGLSYMSLSLTPGSIWVFYGQWIVMSIAGAGTMSGTWTCVVNSWFDRNRGLALGIASTGTGLTGIVIKPLTVYLILTFDWRVAFFIIGLIPILVGLPIVAMLFRERDREPEQPGKVETAVRLTGFALRQAISQRQFWIMCLAFLLISFSLTAPTPNLENILGSLGFDLVKVGQIAAMFGLAVIAGRVIGGWLLDFLWAPLCALLIFMLPAVGAWLLAAPNVSEWTAYAAVISLGFAAGFEFDLLAYLVSRYFGQRNYGAIYGCFFSVVVIGGGLGPVVYGSIFDSTGSYASILPVGSVVLLGGALLLLFMGAYPSGFPQQKKVSR